MEQVGPLSLLVGMVGLYLLLRQAQTRRLGAYLFAVVLLHSIGRAVLGFDVANPDAHGYLSPAGDVLALFACAAVGGLLCLDALRAPRRAWLAPALSTVLLISGAAWGVREPDRSLRSGFWDLDLVIGSWLAEAPPRARLLSSHFQTVFGLYYLMGVEGQRPDLEHWHPHFLKNPGHREDLLARFPHTSDLPEIFGPEADPGLRVPPLVLAAARRPTLIEYDLDAPRALVPMLAPAGLAEVIAPPVSFSAARAAAAQQTRDALVDAADLTEPETRRNLLWRSYIRLDLFCAQGDRPSFFSELARTRRLLQGAKSDEVDKLEHRCGGLLR